MTVSLMHQWHDTICGGVIGLPTDERRIHPRQLSELLVGIPLLFLDSYHSIRPSFEPVEPSTATTLVDVENWIAHIEKIFEILRCANEFKARLASYKLEGDALNWWKDFKQAKGGDTYVATLSWKDFCDIFFLQYFPRSEQQKYEKEYHTIRQRDRETGGEFMKRFLRLAGFVGKKAGPPEEQAKHFMWALCVGNTKSVSHFQVVTGLSS
ncbi:zinc finger, CCHC-type, retrotransposon gag domain protein [Tanacetum coccineum]